MLIDHTNKIYKMKGWAIVDEVPIPITITEDNGRYIKGFKKSKSTVDYVGISHGKGIAFDAKSTKNKTSFPLSNVHEHQVEYLIKFHDQGGKAFFLIEFEKHHKFFFVPITFFLKYWDGAKKGERKSIPFDVINLNCDQIISARGVVLDYLKYCG